MRYFNPNNMLRPAWKDLAAREGYVECSCGDILQTTQTTRDHWQLGHFDVPAQAPVELDMWVQLTD